MFDNVLHFEPQKKNTDLRASTGVKDPFLNFFLEKLERLRKKTFLNSEDRETAAHRMLEHFPTNLYSPVWRLKGESSVSYIFEVS
jgi:hypothetical protein